MASKGPIKYPIKDPSYKNSLPDMDGHSDLMDYNSQIRSVLPVKYLPNLAHTALRSLIKQYPAPHMPS